ATSGSNGSPASTWPDAMSPPHPPSAASPPRGRGGAFRPGNRDSLAPGRGEGRGEGYLQVEVGCPAEGHEEGLERNVGVAVNAEKVVVDGSVGAIRLQHFAHLDHRFAGCREVGIQARA